MKEFFLIAGIKIKDFGIKFYRMLKELGLRIKSGIIKWDKTKEKKLSKNISKYVIKYDTEGENLRVYSNLGESRLVKNTKKNEKILNSEIVKNKVAISNKIDSYSDDNDKRFIILLVNVLCVLFCGLFIILSFFTGNYYLFIIAILSFGVSVVCASKTAASFYIRSIEIRNLKRETGYKSETEFNLIDVK